MISQTDWGGSHTHFYGIGSSGPFSNGWIPLFAVIGANNECYYNDNSFSSVASALNLAIESFGLNALMSANVTTGPSNLGVQFHSNSTPGTGIESWEWDLDGDGEIDSTDEDPYFLYTEQGTYDVTLTVTMDGETSTLINENYITVNDGSDIYGNLSGIWHPEYTYIITGDVSIAEGDELIINPGVELQFSDDVQFMVNGTLVADASSTRSEPIVFTSDTSWNGIRFFDTQEDNLLNNCEISNTTVSAIKIEGDSKVDIIGCKIFENNSSAIEVIGSDNVLISQSIIANNTNSGNTAGIICNASSPEITNNVIVNNTGQWGAFSLSNNSNAIITNNTIANNESTNATPYLFFLMNSVPVITNSIIIDNGEIHFVQSTPIITYSCVTGGFTGEGNIDEDPLFVAPTTGDGTDYNGLIASWWLQTGSPCIDAGNPDAMYNDPDGSRNDMGAYGGPNSMGPTDSDDNTVNVVAVNSISVYPNPFNPTTNIALSINENDIQQPVSVEIFNIKGQLVKTLVNNEVVQTTNFVWNGKDNNGNSTSSGMYFVKMKTVSSEVSKKMLLIK
ncbi:MAG: T9SS type A sorting domain-containing protein [Candidatus Cloacimonadota bacterium]|nr:T9SS type A sorting domain-containing protein [Candidatus Cloacimonadota bacterium]